MQKREIKFRAWVLNEQGVGEMTYEPGIEPIKAGESVNLALAFFGDGLMQYTGLKDKNGKEIYEGDIVEMEKLKSGTWELETRVIGWEVGGFVLRLSEKTNERITSIPMTVIGNIYENPELLKA